MTGPEHYAEAERLLGEAWKAQGDQRTWTMAAAQVHATLAHAAASVMYARNGVIETLAADQWRNVTTGGIR